MSVLVIDIGSSSVRAILFDLYGNSIPGATVSRTHKFVTEPPGASTIEIRLLQANVEDCIDELLGHPAAKDIHVVGMDTFVGNVMGVDIQGHPVTPVYSYADMRSMDDVTLLTSSQAAHNAHQRTGCLHHPAYLPGRLQWLRRTEPAVYERVGCWIDLASYLYGQWFGDNKYQCSYSIASWSGLLDREKLIWDHVWLDALDLNSATFPVLTDFDNVRRGLTERYAVRWPTLHKVPFCLAIGDGAAANVGAGCIGPDRIALSLGTTGALRIITEDKSPALPAGLWNYRVTRTQHLIGGATSEGGNIFQWARDTLKLPEKEQDIQAFLAKSQPDSHGLIILPLLAGERSPGWNAAATGVIDGLRLSSSPLEILQALLESVALRLSWIAEQLAPQVADDAIVIASGGGVTSSRIWPQMISNALNKPLHLAANAETTARGTALLALRAIVVRKLSVSPPAISETIYPQPAKAEAMARALTRQKSLYNKLYGHHKS